MSKAELVTKTFDHYQHFDQLFSNNKDPWQVGIRHTERYKRWITNACLRNGKLKAGLEVGCANGISTRALAPRFLHLIAIDGSPAAVELAQREVRNLPHVHIQLRNLPCKIPANRFDAIIANEVLYYLPLSAMTQTLASLYGGLKSGGRFVSINSLRRFSDAECSNQRLVAAARAQFGNPIRTLAGAGWRCDIFQKSLIFKQRDHSNFRQKKGSHPAAL